MLCREGSAPPAAAAAARATLSSSLLPSPPRCAEDAAQASLPALPPPPTKPLPPLAALTRAQPSPVLQYHLLDLLFAYCYVLRLYNGDYTTDPADAAGLAFSLSAVLEATAAAAAGGPAAAAGAQPAPGAAGAGAAGEPSAASTLLDCIRWNCGDLRLPAACALHQAMRRAGVAVL